MEAASRARRCLPFLLLLFASFLAGCAETMFWRGKPLPPPAAPFESAGQGPDEAAANASHPQARTNSATPRKEVSLAEVTRAARERAFTVLEAAARLRQAAGEARATRAALFPRLGLGITGSFLDGQQVGSFGEVRDVSFARFEPAAFLFYRFNPGRAIEEARKWREEEKAARYGAENAKRVAALQAGLAYFDVVLAYASTKIAQDLVGDAKQFLSIVREQTRAGIASGADLARAEAELARAQQAEARARGRWETTSVRLATLLRWDPERRIVPAEKALQPAALLDPGEIPKEKDALAARPDLQAARARTRAAKNERAAVWWPSDRHRFGTVRRHDAGSLSLAALLRPRDARPLAGRPGCARTCAD